MGQVERGHPVFTGARTQRGCGLGGILGGLFRSAMSLIKQGAKTLGREALRTGVGIAQDAMEGKDIKKAAKSRLLLAGRNLTNKAVRSVRARTSQGSRRGIKRKATGRGATSTSGRKRQRSLDIFD